jgi:polyisoprenoid-binding protein YceI
MRSARFLAALFIVVTLQAQEPNGRIDLLGAELFSLDRSHSHLEFAIGFMGLTKVRGTFNDFTATILYDDKQPERSSLTFSIDATTIDTNSEFRDKDLQAETWFATAKHPRIVFQSTRIERKDKDRYLVHGDLTMKGVTKSIAIPMSRTVPRSADAGWGNIRIGGTGAVTINRRDFGLDGPEFWSKALTDTVDITIDLLGSRPNWDRRNFPRGEKPAIGEVLMKTLETGTGAAAAAQFRELRATKANEYDFGPGQLNTVANRLIQHGKVQDALPILIAGAEAWPEESGFHARLGEAYAMLGDKAKAIAAYEKAQTINPHATEAKEMLRRLR